MKTTFAQISSEDAFLTMYICVFRKMHLTRVPLDMRFGRKKITSLPEVNLTMDNIYYPVADWLYEI